MSDPNTLRILSLDGGGMRGYISANFLKSFVDLWGIEPTELWKYFDVVAGSSIGGIMALALAAGKSPEELLPFYTEDGPWIFTTSTSTPSVMPSTLSKINTIVGGPLSNPTFYPSDKAGIGTMRLKSKLDSVFGNKVMTDLKTTTVITSFEKNAANPDFAKYTNTPVYFSNSKIVPSLVGQDFKASDIAMATSAAPLYFPAWAIGEDKFIDGGVVQNNPANFALTIAKAKKPTANRYCVLSLGTGLGDVGFAPSEDLKLLKNDRRAFAAKWQISDKEAAELQKLAGNLKAMEGANLIMYLIGAMTAGSQEIAAKDLSIQTNYTLENLYSYRMQFYLDPAKDTELDNSTPEILSYYKEATAEYFDNDIDNITTFLGHLTA